MITKVVTTRTQSHNRRILFNAITFAFLNHLRVLLFYNKFFFTADSNVVTSRRQSYSESISLESSIEVLTIPTPEFSKA